jgi:hypothetical protein
VGSLSRGRSQARSHDNNYKQKSITIECGYLLIYIFRCGGCGRGLKLALPQTFEYPDTTSRVIKNRLLDCDGNVSTRDQELEKFKDGTNNLGHVLRCEPIKQNSRT